MAWLASTALAADDTFQFAIPPQPLATALATFARQTGLLMSYPAQLVDGLQSPGVSGSHAPASALPLLLRGSGLNAQLTAGNVVTLVKDPNPATEFAPALLDPVYVTATAPKALSESFGEGDYSRRSSTTTKLDLPILETPANVQIVTRQAMQDQQVLRLEDALRNVSATGSQGGPYGWGSAFSVRGFHTYQYYRDGVMVPFDTFNDGYRDFANIARVEVLKGPASVLYGRMEPGGMINLVTKQPEPEVRHALQQQIGSFGFYRSTLDTTGPLGTAGNLAYRFNLAYESAGSFREFMENHRVFAAPVLHWDLSGSTQATFYLEYLDSRDGVANDLPIPGNRPPEVPPGRNLGEAGSHKDFRSVRGGLSISHRLSDAWFLRGRFDGFSSDSRDRFSTWLGVMPGTVCSTEHCLVSRSLLDGSSDGRSQSALLELTGSLRTWNLEHSLVAGADFFHQNAALGRPHHPYANYAGDRFLPPIDLYDPHHSGKPNLALGTPDLLLWSRYDERWIGAYLHDRISLPGHVQFLAGARYDSAAPEAKLSFSYPEPAQFAQQSREAALTPRFGLSWQLLRTLGLYGNYVESFGPSSSIGLGNVSDYEAPLPPTRARQWEFGAKLESPDGRLQGSLAWFDITKSNLPSSHPDPRRAAEGLRAPTGAARNRGLELDIAGELWPGLKLIGSYAFIDSVITRDRRAVFDSSGSVIGYARGNQGNRLFDVARNGGSLWLDFQPDGDLLKGWKLGAGVFARSARQGDDANSFTLPGYVLVNLMAGYSWPFGPSRLSVQLNVNNLLDKVYWESSNYGGRLVLAGPPRTVLGLMRVEF